MDAITIAFDNSKIYIQLVKPIYTFKPFIIKIYNLTIIFAKVDFSLWTCYPYNFL